MPVESGVAVVARRMRALIATLGLCISIYALYVEHMLDSDSQYKPLCDVAEHVSCSRAFNSQFAKGLGATALVLGADHLLTQRNPVYGCISYSLMVLLQVSSGRLANKLSLVLAIFMNLLSVYLFFVLIYLRTVCLVCVAIYVVNALLLYHSLPKRRKHNKKKTG